MWIYLTRRSVVLKCLTHHAKYLYITCLNHLFELTYHMKWNLMCFTCDEVTFHIFCKVCTFFWNMHIFSVYFDYFSVKIGKIKKKATTLMIVKNNPSCKGPELAAILKLLTVEGAGNFVGFHHCSTPSHYNRFRSENLTNDWLCLGDPPAQSAEDVWMKLRGR